MLETKTVTNGLIALQVERVCHDTLDFIQVPGFPSAIRVFALTHSRRIVFNDAPWLISFSLGLCSAAPESTHYNQMPTKPIPEGFHAITPYLFAQGASRLIEFISAAFEG